MRVRLPDVRQGNLSVHLRKLEEAGYVSIDKSFLDRKPLTRVRMTAQGRAAFAGYLEAIGKLVGEGRGEGRTFGRDTVDSDIYFTYPSAPNHPRRVIVGR